MSGSSSDVLHQAHEWRARREDGPLTPDEDAEFRTWIADPLNMAAYAEAEITWKSLADQDVVEALSNLGVPDLPVNASRPGFLETVKDLFSSPTRLATAALCFGVVMGSASLLPMLNHKATTPPPSQSESSVSPSQTAQPTPEIYSTVRSEIRRVFLPDGSIATLAPRSSIEVSFSEGQRDIVLLSGSAYFDVEEAQASAFSVRAGAAKVAVTGTEFSVQMLNESVRVAVVEGDVSVALRKPFEPNASQALPRELNSPNGDPVQLSVGEEITISGAQGLGAKQLVPIDQVAPWRNGRLVYIDAELGDVVRDMRDYMFVAIDISDEASRLKLSGTFASDDMEAMLQVLEIALPITVSKTASQIDISTSD